MGSAIGTAIASRGKVVTDPARKPVRPIGGARGKQQTPARKSRYPAR